MKVLKVISYSKKRWRNKITSRLKWVNEKEHKYKEVISLVRLGLKIYNVLNCSEIYDFLLYVKKIFVAWF